MIDEALVTISEASQFLGVSEAALRQWTDEGKIKAFITPGGHRRYSREELKKFSSTQPKMLGLKDLVVELEDTVDRHREIARAYLKKIPWYGDLSPRSQEKLAEIGRSLLNLIIKYVAEPSRRKETLEQIKQVGASLGELLAQLQIPLSDSVEAFLVHREPIIGATTHLMKKREAFAGRIIGVIPMIGNAFDEALIALVSVHQSVRSEARDRQEADK
jgi:excisionase family DNA binding protein